MQIRRLGAAALAVLALSAHPAAGQTPTAGQVVDRWVEAIGGRERLEAVQSRHMLYEMNAAGGVIVMDVRMRRPGMGISTMATPMGEIVSGTDGRTVWVRGPQGFQRLEGAAAEEVILRTGFDADLLFDIYETMEVAGREEFAGRACWNVRMVLPGGSESYRCFDVETGLLVATTQNQQGMQVVGIVEDYLEADGIRYPSRTVANVMGQEVVTVLLSVDHSPIAEEEFAVPAS